MGMADDMRNLAQEILASYDARMEWVANVKRETADLMRQIQARQRERNREVADFLTGFRRELQEMAGHWRNLTATMERKRAGQR